MILFKEWPYSYQTKSLSPILLSETQKDLELNFLKLLESYEVGKFCLAHIESSSSSQKKADFFDTYPNDWIAHYHESDYHLCDPVFSNYGKLHTPFQWNTSNLLQKDLNKKQQKFIEEANDRGIRKGITLPLLPQLKEQSFLTILDYNNLHAEVLSVLSAASDMYCRRRKYFKTRSLFNRLTQRELEAIHHKSQGTSLQEISRTLQISPATVNFHLQRACKKLEVPSVQQALFLFGQQLTV